METLFFKGEECHTAGNLPTVGQTAPEFELAGKGLESVSLDEYKGKRVVLNIFPSLDTEVCARSVRRFNEEAAKLDNTAVICVSVDLPFAMGRFCAANGIENVTVASAFRNEKFAQDYGVQLIDGPLRGLLARAVIIIDTDGKVIYRDLVNEITDDPHYQEALDVLKR